MQWCTQVNIRLILGVSLLLVVNIIWVGSSELSYFIYNGNGYNKPYFTTYLKTSLFSFYLLGFLFFEPWRAQCRRGSNDYFSVKTDDDDESDKEEYYPHPLADPVYVPISMACTPPSGSSRNSSPCPPGELDCNQPPHVKFANVVEVRNLSDSEEGRLARMSFAQSQNYANRALQRSTKLSVVDTARIALTFCFVWFIASWSYGEALSLAEPSVVNVLSSTSGIFVCVLAALFPSGPIDNFTFSKFVAAVLSTAGVLLITLSTEVHDHPVTTISPSLSSTTATRPPDIIPLASGHNLLPVSNEANDASSQFGVLWALLGAFGYAVYLVTLKHQVGGDDNLDITLFFGFVGIFAATLLWPGIYVVNAIGWEPFEWPDLTTLGFIAANGVVGTVLSEYLWLYGCFLTSSLAGTLSLSLTTPLSMLADMLFRGTRFSWQLYVGICPIMISFFAVTMFQHYNNWDPVGDILVRIVTVNRTRRPRSNSGSRRGSTTRSRVATPRDNEDQHSLLNGMD